LPSVIELETRMKIFHAATCRSGSRAVASSGASRSAGRIAVEEGA